MKILGQNRKQEKRKPRAKTEKKKKEIMPIISTIAFMAMTVYKLY